MRMTGGRGALHRKSVPGTRRILVPQFSARHGTTMAASRRRVTTMKRLLLSLAAMSLLAGTAFAQDVCAPAKVTVLSTITWYGAVQLTWTATGDDCTTGNALTYEVRWSTHSFSESDWQKESTQLETGSSAANGSENTGCWTISPCATTTYYFAVFVIDEAGNRS